MDVTNQYSADSNIFSTTLQFLDNTRNCSLLQSGGIASALSYRHNYCFWATSGALSFWNAWPSTILTTCGSSLSWSWTANTTSVPSIAPSQAPSRSVRPFSAAVYLGIAGALVASGLLLAVCIRYRKWRLERMHSAEQPLFPPDDMASIESSRVN